MTDTSIEPPFAADDIPQLDFDQHANSLGHNMIDSPVGRECEICWACTCHSKDYLLKPCLGLQLKKKEQPE